MRWGGAVSGTSSYQPENKQQKTKGQREEETWTPGPGSSARLSAQRTGPSGEPVQASPGAQGHATLFFILFLGWALVDKGRLVFSSLFCLTAVKLPFSKATFKKR